MEILRIYDGNNSLRNQVRTSFSLKLPKIRRFCTGAFVYSENALEFRNSNILTGLPYRGCAEDGIDESDS